VSFFFDTVNGVKQPEGYTVWVCEIDSSGDPVGTHHISYHQGTVQEAKNAARLDTAIEWYNQSSDEFTNPLHILGVCSGNVHVDEWDEKAM
jgi:hypothetical protein